MSPRSLQQNGGLQRPAFASPTSSALGGDAPPHLIHAPSLHSAILETSFLFPQAELHELRGKKEHMEAPAAATETGGDRIGALPDGVLEDILGFLPAQDAVRSCMLARRWRHLWKSAKALRIAGADGKFLGSVKELREFVDCLLLSRGGAPLDTFELRFGDFGDLNFSGFSGEDLPRLNTWFRYAVTRKARVLRLRLHNDYEGYHTIPELLDGLPLVSMHLTRLELHGVGVCSSFPDFSSCPALEHLEFNKCEFKLVKKISSDSLKYLSIADSVCGFYDSFRTHICAPNLVSLRLDQVYGGTPVLGSIPSLVEAFVRIPEACVDQCLQWNTNYWDCDCKSCDSYDSSGDGRGCHVLLKGLSQAKKLELLSYPEMYIFKRDLRCCPTFSKLKSLLLDDYWSEPDDLRALACILEHSPVLEKLTLQLFSEVPKTVEEMKGSPDPTELSAAISECLQIVEVKYEVIDEKVLNVFKFLCKLGICKSLLTLSVFCSLLSHVGKKACNEESSKFIWKTASVTITIKNILVSLTSTPIPLAKIL